MSNILQDQDNNGTLVMIGVDGELPIQDLDYLDKTSSIEYLVLKNISNPVRHGICHKWHLWKVFFQELTQKNYPICEISQIQAWVFSKQLEWICI